MLSFTLGSMLVILGVGIPIAAGLILLALLIGAIYSPMPLWFAAGELAWGTANEFTLFAIPLYILLGEILLRSGISGRMYQALAQWLSWLPGGLMHANIGFSTMFAAMSGSSVASASTLGTLANPQIGKYQYNERLFLGSVAAGGTIGILIPPSIPLIVYGVMTDTSIPKLYLAGFIPGAILASIFSLTILGACLLQPAWSGKRFATNWLSRLRVLPDLVPPLMIFLVVIGAIYAGWATPTESAALGVIVALALAASRNRLNIEMLNESLVSTVRTTAMITLVLVAAFFLNFVVGAIGLSQFVTRIITESNLTANQLILLILIFYLILGMFMETLSMMIATVPVILPAALAAGIDPVWFGILMMLLLETSLLTPPVGINLFVVQGTREHGPLKDVVIGASPFLVALFVVIGLLIVFPGLALYLPGVFG
jgi:tripartite ATP-independent transporter DctM subunit